jgi:hypothetical protein
MTESRRSGRGIGYVLKRRVADVAGSWTRSKHVRSILAKLSLCEVDDDHRRVLAVLTFLEAS